MINKVFNRTLHKSLWYWLAENPKCTKDQWPGWISNGWVVERVVQLCFACEYTFDEYFGCRSCPIEWSSGKPCYDAEYEQWEESVDPQERTRLALVIAELPVREGVVCK